MTHLPTYGTPFNPGQPVPCTTSPDLFTAGPSKGNYRRNPTPEETRAIDLCHTCPVFDRCRDWALQHALGEEIVMGGMTGYQRRKHSRYIPPGRPCRNGHPEQAMYLRSDGQRACRQCQREREQQLRKQRRQARETVAS